MDVSELKKDAVWVIMDPWQTQPLGRRKLPTDINEHNKKTAIKINEYIYNTKNVVVSCPKTHLPVIDCFSSLINVENSILKLLSYCIEKNASSIVYCGFHYGHCILFKPDGAKYINNIEYRKKTISDEWNRLWNDYKGSSWLDCYSSIENFDQLDQAIQREILNIKEFKDLLVLFESRKKTYDVYIKKDLSCLLPGDDRDLRNLVSMFYATLI